MNRITKVHSFQVVKIQNINLFSDNRYTNNSVKIRGKSHKAKNK